MAIDDRPYNPSCHCEEQYDVAISRVVF
jgi:hypothetical protein